MQWKFLGVPSTLAGKVERPYKNNQAFVYFVNMVLVSDFSPLVISFSISFRTFMHFLVIDEERD